LCPLSTLPATPLHTKAGASALLTPINLDKGVTQGYGHLAALEHLLELLNRLTTAGAQP
jgi:hypothetical protein